MTENTFAFLVVISLAMIIPAIIIGLSHLLGRKKYDPVKMEAYESGIRNVIGTSRERFSIKFYLIAIMFIIFDVETVFMFPWAVNFRELGIAGFLEMILFILILLAGFIYILKKGALKWD